MNYPEIDPIIFQIGPVAVRWYGLMYLVGFALAYFLLRKRARVSERWTPKDVEDLIFFAALGVIVGGRIGYVLLYQWQTFLADPLYLVRITQGGMSFHGGLVGVLLGVGWFARSRGMRFFEVADFLAPGAPLGLFFGRLGNFINGELWGKPTEVPWGFVVDGQKLHPSQLYEAFLEGLVLFAIVWVFSSRPRPTMAVSGVFLFFYGLFRFLVEFVRVPDAHLGEGGYLAFGWLTMGQVLSLPMMLAGAALLWLAYRGGDGAAAQAAGR